MDPTSITEGVFEVVNRGLAALAVLGLALILAMAVPLRKQWRLLARGPRWGNLWSEFEVEQRFESSTSERRAA
jgi:hypothetical protein